MEKVKSVLNVIIAGVQSYPEMMLIFWVTSLLGVVFMMWG